MKLSPSQIQALLGLYDGDHSAYRLGVRLETLYVLRRHEMVKEIGVGHTLSPRNASWRITKKGKAAIAEKAKNL